MCLIFNELILMIGSDRECWRARTLRPAADTDAGQQTGSFGLTEANYASSSDSHSSKTDFHLKSFKEEKTLQNSLKADLKQSGDPGESSAIL